MNPRLTCRLARTWSAVRDHAPSTHLASCSDCQAFLARATSLEDSLRAAAPARRPAPPADLDRHILAAIAESRRPTPAPARSRPWLPLATFAGAAAALAIAFVALQRPASEAGLTRDDAAALAATVGDLSTQLVEQVLPSTGTLIAENPLQDELGAVYTDARTALDFLALNFLPRSTALNTSTPAPRRGTG